MRSIRAVFFAPFLFACLICHAAAPVRLQVTLSSTSVKVNSSFMAKVVLVDAHAAPASASGACPVALDVLDTQTQRGIQPTATLAVPGGQSTAEAKLVIRKVGFFGVRASTACMPGIQNGMIYVRVSAASASLARPYLLLVAQPAPTKGTIDVFYPQDANHLVADGQVPATIQVFVDPPIPFKMFFDTNASVTPNPLIFPGTNGDAAASLTSTQPGDFTAVVSASSIPEGYVVHTHPATPPAHHFGPDIRFIRLTASSQKGVPVNSDVNLVVELLDGQHKTVKAEDAVPVDLHVNPGAAVLKANPLVVPGGQSSSITSVRAPQSGPYLVDAASGDAKSEAPLDITVTAPIGFWAILVGGVVGGCISCLRRKKFDWTHLVYGGLAATGVWLVSGIGVLANVSSSLVSNSFSAGILGALAGLVGAQLVALLVKGLFGVTEDSEPEPGSAAHAASPEK